MKGYVYALASKQEDKIYYIGSSINPQLRLTQHMCYYRIMDEKTLDYIPSDKKDFILSIIEELDFTERKELLDAEIFWIHQFYQWGFTLKNNIKATRNYRFGAQFQMTIEKASEIRRSDKKGKELANIYGVSYTTIRSIINNKSWLPKKQV